jgi:signal transduction histidine kinase
VRRWAIRLLAALLEAVLLCGALVALALAFPVWFVIVAGAATVPATRRIRRRARRSVMLRLGDAGARRSVALELFGADGAQGPTLPSCHAIQAAAAVRYAAIDIWLDGATVRLADAGAAPAGAGRGFPIVHGGEHVGTLVLGPPRSGGGWQEPALELAADIAALAGPAVAAARARRVLDAERTAAAARDAAERRRIGHDVHDRVGSSVAALKMMLAARRAGAGRSLAAEALADQAAAAAREVRDVRDAVGPTDLADAGLVGAIETMAARLAADGGPRMSVSCAGDPSALGPAVAAAAYAIAAEALTNVVRHSGAGACSVRLRFGESLCLTVADDGAGARPGTDDGIGSESMRHRAVELGGTLTISSPPHGGTLVAAELPSGGVSARASERTSSTMPAVAP